MTFLSCRLCHAAGRDAAYFALCNASLPPNYLARIAGGSNSFNIIPGSLILASSHTGRDANLYNSSGM